MTTNQRSSTPNRRQPDPILNLIERSLPQQQVRTIQPRSLESVDPGLLATRLKFARLRVAVASRAARTSAASTANIARQRFSPQKVADPGRALSQRMVPVARPRPAWHDTQTPCTSGKRFHGRRRRAPHPRAVNQQHRSTRKELETNMNTGIPSLGRFSQWPALAASNVARRAVPAHLRLPGW